MLRKNAHDDPSSNNFNSIGGNLINQSEKSSVKEGKRPDNPI